MKKLPFVNSFTSDVPQTKNKSLFLSSQIQIWAVEGECAEENTLGSLLAHFHVASFATPEHNADFCGGKICHAYLEMA